MARQVPPFDPDGTGVRWRLREARHDLGHWARSRRGHRAADATSLLGDIVGRSTSMAGAWIRYQRDRGRPGDRSDGGGAADT